MCECGISSFWTLYQWLAMNRLRRAGRQRGPGPANPREIVSAVCCLRLAIHLLRLADGPWMGVWTGL